MVFSPRIVFRLDTFIACLFAAMVVLCIAWSCERQNAERESRQITQTRLQALAHELSKQQSWPAPTELVRTGRCRDENLKDGWGYPLHLDEKESTVYSLGADGLPGGGGFGEDIVVKVK